MGMDFRTDRVTDLANEVRSGRRTAVSLTAHALERIEALNPAVNAFVAVDAQRALEQAEGVDQVIAAGGDPGGHRGQGPRGRRRVPDHPRLTPPR